MPYCHFIIRSSLYVCCAALCAAESLYAQTNDAYTVPANQPAAVFNPKRNIDPPQPDAELRQVKESFYNAPANRSSAGSRSTAAPAANNVNRSAAQVSFAAELDAPRRINEQHLQSAEPLPPPDNRTGKVAGKPVAQAAFHHPPKFASEDTETAARDEPAREPVRDASADVIPASLPPPAAASDEILDKPLKRKKNKNNVQETEPENAAAAAEDETGAETLPAQSKRADWKNKVTSGFGSSLSPMISVAGSLIIVVSLFFLIAILFKKVSPKGSRPLPKEAFENLGRTYITAKQQLQLLRLGNRLILVSVTPDGVSPVSEVTDSDEVLSLLGMCRRLDSNSATALFQKTVSRITDDEINQSRRSGHKQSSRRQSSLVDLYSDPDESLAEILAKR
ncbi:MAG: flagellar biosynthetic protein FliO [Planctomycetaceae bacterium]|jgi:flagellar biogenesis protein FliO|nr:flagellar biosynthetic protein FliO [Planctomycetaceae bacterium]